MESEKPVSNFQPVTARDEVKELLLVILPLLEMGDVHIDPDMGLSVQV